MINALLRITYIYYHQQQDRLRRLDLKRKTKLLPIRFAVGDSLYGFCAAEPAWNYLITAVSYMHGDTDAEIGGIVDIDYLCIELDTNGCSLEEGRARPDQHSRSYVLEEVGPDWTVVSDEPYIAENGDRVDRIRHLSSDILSTIRRRLGMILPEFELSVRTMNTLQQEGIWYISELLQRTREELLSIEGIGVRTLDEILTMLEKQGFRLPDKPGGKWSAYIC